MRSFMTRHPIASFLTLFCGLGWACFVPSLLGNQATERDQDSQPGHVGMARVRGRDLAPRGDGHTARPARGRPRHHPERRQLTRPTPSPP